MRKFETDYRIAKTSEVLPTENKFRFDVDLRLDAVELALQQLGSGADTLVARVLRVIEQEIAPRAAEIEALLTDYRTGVPAASVQEEADGRQFLTPERRIAILGELRGGVDASGDTLAKLLALIAALDAAKAPIANAHLTGVPTAPTATLGTSTTQIATTAFVAAALSALKGSAPAAYDTLEEIATRLATSDTLEAAMITALAARLRLDVPFTYTGAQIDQGRANLLLPAADVALSELPLVYNGSFSIDQRNAGAAVPITTSWTFSADRWAVTSSAAPSGTLEAQVLSTNVAASPWCLRLSRKAGNFASKLNAVQVFERCGDLAGRVVTLSFKARKGSAYSASTLSAYIISGSGLNEGVSALFSWSGYSFQQASFIPTTDLQMFSLTVTIPNSARELAVLFATGNFSGSGSANDYIEITDVRLEHGSLATPFVRLPDELELSRCRKFFETGLATWIGYQYVGNGYGSVQPFKAEKRVTPTLTTSTLTVSNLTGAGVLASGVVGLSLAGYATATGSIVYSCSYAADAEIR